MSHDKAKTRAFLALTLGAALIAIAPNIVKVLKDDISPLASAFWRLLLAQPFFWIFYYIDGKKHPQRINPKSKKDFFSVMIIGIIFTINLGIGYISIIMTNIANATLLANFAPIFVTLFGWLFFKEKVNKTFIMGMLTAILGAVFLLGSSLKLETRFIQGDALGLLTAVFYGCYILAVNRARKTFSTITIMAWSGLSFVIFMLPFAFLYNPEKFLPQTAKIWGLLFAMAIVAQGGQALIAYAMGYLSAALSSVSLIIQPTLATFIAWGLFGEYLTKFQITGAVIILFGIYTAKKSSS